MSKFFSFACEHPFDPRPLVEQIILSPSNYLGTFVENGHTCVCLFMDLLCFLNLYVLTLILHFFDYCKFIYLFVFETKSHSVAQAGMQ